jgi:hypothetical protein
MSEGRIEISENHERIIRITLGLLDEALCGFEHWAQGHETHSVLFHERNMLSTKQREALLRDVEAARTLLTKIRDSLGLKPVIKNVDGSIRGSCMVLISDLIELGPKYLKGYGEPPEELARFLEPSLDGLMTSLERILTAVTRNELARIAGDNVSSVTMSSEED